MSAITDAIRPFWMSNLNQVTGKLDHGLAIWIATGNFQVYDQIHNTACVLTVSENTPVCKAFGFDCNRLGIASFESLLSIAQSPRIPKSTAWLIIQMYYAAFFAAHSTLRMLGISCTQLDSTQTSNVNTVANLFGYRNGISLEKGFYKCQFDSQHKTLSCSKLTASSSKGSHSIMWEVYHDTLRDVSNNILSGTSNTITAESQKASITLSEICDSISSAGHKGDWLSHIRNRVNYGQEFGTWYPYHDYQRYYDELYKISQYWTQLPEDISVWPQAGRDLQKFTETCVRIIALYRVIVLDMAERCPKGRAKSFHTFGTLGLLNNVGM